jgi:predicted ribonuclease YlaK
MKGRNNRRQTRQVKQETGLERVVNKKPSFDRDWDLDWFIPEGKQKFIVELMDEKELVVVQGASGTGKSSVVLWKALKDYKQGKYRKVILIKTPCESGSDQIGFLAGDRESKLEAHFESMEYIFHQFMTKEKLKNDRAAANIVLEIPNFLQGKTFDDSIIVLDESQNMDPLTVKLCAERAGRNSKVVVVGDPRQTYAIKKRQDGLKDLIEKVTHEYSGLKFSKYPRVGFVKLETDHNMRSNLSRFITEIYE